MAIEKAREKTQHCMAIFMKVSGKMINNKARVNSHILMETFMKVIG
jgi:hypothetical protein